MNSRPPPYQGGAIATKPPRHNLGSKTMVYIIFCKTKEKFYIICIHSLTIVRITNKGDFMKIGIFTNVYKPVINGVVNSISALKQGLEELGHDVYVFAPKHPNYKDNEKGIFRIESIKLSSKEEYRLSLPIFRKSSKVIKELDIIHTQYPFIMGNYASFFADIYNKPLVFTHHTPVSYTHLTLPTILLV